MSAENKARVDELKQKIRQNIDKLTANKNKIIDLEIKLNPHLCSYDELQKEAKQMEFG